MALIPCPECKSEISDKAEFCPRCGYKKGTEVMTESHLILCPECKKDIDPDSQFCSYCGYKIVSKPPIIQEVPKSKQNRQLPQCPNCKRDVTFTAEKCPYCGHKLVPQKLPEESYLIQCPKCKRDILGTSEYCPYCGPTKSNHSSDVEEVDWESKLNKFSNRLEKSSDAFWKFGIRMTVTTIVVALFIMFFARMCV